MIISMFSDDGISLEPTEAVKQRNLKLAERHRAKGNYVRHIQIDIKGSITEELFCDVMEKLASVPAAHSIDLIIDCPGGECFPAMLLHKQLRDHPAERKTAHIVGSCESGGLLIALAADRRIASRKASFLIHQTRCGEYSVTSWTTGDFQRQADQFRAIDADLITIIAQRTGIDVSTIRDTASDEEPSSIEWCLENGIIHEIGEDRP
ncbi:MULTISPECIES: ATP-dependent Clp protease proteolytic subunit [Brucella/Ochrobactrum group]|uniref:ATP-dependent Clp protease proteolytic subunit n=1 Tax=Brucella/Ochrobactrum group TaxID=2826938 RepID=UPI001E3A489A|nr:MULTISPECIES: ATP-dependent Clp protease proteolytic subunit [Brucella/Ochrobactrum group]MCQ9144570.1 ATP-dependent Clp protease proteolytic subunit [Ochrobactrum sp. BTU2]UGQ21434.1 ATP-dependent Clp protease proteolytic subunit [Brucella anthropi]